MRALLQISAGMGPWETRRFVALLAPLLRSRCEALGLIVEAEMLKGDPEAPRSITLLLQEVNGQLDDLLGSHCWRAQSPRRGQGSRKRWYVGVSLHPLQERRRMVAPEELEWSSCRARGPGGQHVNRRESAVLLYHRPTGTRLRSEGSRSQWMNRRAALQRLEQLLAQGDQAKKAQGRSARRAAHYRFERGNPVCIWRGEPLRPL